jgi:hypothetical protein
MSHTPRKENAHVRDEFASSCLVLVRTFSLFVIGAAFVQPVVSTAQIDVTTFKYDNARTGQNLHETILTPQSVSSGAFHKLFTVAVDGYVYAQPLYVASLKNIQGGLDGHAYNVVFVATEANSIYAIDADSDSPTGTILWHRAYGGVGEVPVDSLADLHCSDLMPKVGITGTPVIDKSSATLYMVTKSKDSNGQFHQRLHAIALSDGSEKFGGPVLIEASTSDHNSTFDSLREFNRAALLLDHGSVVIGWASHCDNGPFHGWVLSYSAATLVQEGVFNTTPNGSEGGVWMSGDGIAADSDGRLFFATGNGTYDGNDNHDYGDSIVRLDRQIDGAMHLGDWFTPYNQDVLNNGIPAQHISGDQDLGSGGIVLLPDLPPGSSHPHLLVQMGKEGKMYLIDRDSMGHYCNGCAGDTQIAQEIPGAASGMWGAPAYWNGNIYWSSGRPTDSFKAWQFNARGSGRISAAPSSKSTKQFHYSTASPVISANGTTNGIAWLLDNSGYVRDPTTPAGAQILYAFDATNLSKVLYVSNQVASGRDQPGGAVKFASPVVANGRVFAGAAQSLSAWGTTNQSVNASSRTTTH